MVSFADPWTPRERLVVGARHGDREERRTLECSTEVAPYLAQREQLDAEAGEAGTIAGWPGLAQVCRIHREVEYVSGARAGARHPRVGVRADQPAARAGGCGALGAHLAGTLAD